MQNTYKTFPLLNLQRDWEKLISYTEEQIKDLQNEWLQIHEGNRYKSVEVAKMRNEKRKEIEQALKNAGITYEKKQKSLSSHSVGYLAWFDKNVVQELAKKYPSYNNSFPSPSMSPNAQEVNGVTVKLHRSVSNIVDLHRAVTHEYNRVIKQREEDNLLLVRSIEYATKNGIPLEGMTSHSIIATVRESAVEEYLRNELPDGMEINISSCSECSTYTVGEHRCDCGNSRIGIVVEGDIVSGFYYYDERN